MASDDNYFLYQVDQTVLCCYGQLIYEAKCLKIKIVDGIPQYFIHYKGWKKKYDEWVNHDRLLEVNSANMDKMNELKKLYLPKKEKNKLSLSKKIQRRKVNKHTVSKLSSLKLNQCIATPVVVTEPNDISKLQKPSKPSRPNRIINSPVIVLNSTSDVDNKKANSNHIKTEKIDGSKLPIIKDDNTLQKERKRPYKSVSPKSNEKIKVTFAKEKIQLNKRLEPELQPSRNKQICITPKVEKDSPIIKPTNIKKRDHLNQSSVCDQRLRRLHSKTIVQPLESSEVQIVPMNQVTDIIDLTKDEEENVENQLVIHIYINGKIGTTQEQPMINIHTSCLE